MATSEGGFCPWVPFSSGSTRVSDPIRPMENRDQTRVVTGEMPDERERGFEASRRVGEDTSVEHPCPNHDGNSDVTRGGMERRIQDILVGKGEEMGIQKDEMKAYAAEERGREEGRSSSGKGEEGGAHWTMRCGWTRVASVAWTITTAAQAQEADGGDGREAKRSTNDRATAKWRVFTDRARELCQQKKFEEAEGFLRKALQEAQVGFGDKDGHVAAAKQNLADVHRLQNKHEDAEKMYGEALQLLVEAEGADHPSVGALLDHMGLFYAQQEKWKDAEKAYRKALVAKKESLGNQHQEYAATLALLAEALAKQKKMEAALAAMEESVRVVDSTGLVSPVVLNKRMLKLASMYVQARKWGDAANWHARAIQELELNLGHSHPQVALVCEDVGVELAQGGRGDSAIPYLEKAAKIWEEVADESIQRGRVLRRLVMLRLASDTSPSSLDSCFKDLQTSLAIAKKVWTKTLNDWKSGPARDPDVAKVVRYSLHKSAEEFSRTLLVQGVLLHFYKNPHEEKGTDPLYTCTETIEDLKSCLSGQELPVVISQLEASCSRLHNEAAKGPFDTFRATIINML